MDNGKAERIEQTQPVPGENWNFSATERDPSAIGRTAFFSPREEAAEETPEIEIVPLSAPETPVERNVLVFDPADVHPDRYDLSRETEKVVEDVMRIESPSDLMANYQAMSDLYNAADANTTGYGAYLESARKKAA